MMRPETQLRIYRAACDWLSGYSIKELAVIYQRTEWTVYAWKKTQVWAETVAGRVRQEPKRPAKYKPDHDQSLIEFAAYLWMARGKPPKEEFAIKFGMPQKDFERWMASPFWAYTVRHAEAQAEHKEHQAGSKRQVGFKFPYHLLKRAVSHYLAGWTMKQIGAAIGKSHWTVMDWRETDAWEAVQEEVLLEKLKNHVLTKNWTTGALYQERRKRQIITRETRVRIYMAAEHWLSGYSIKALADRHNRSTWTIHAWKRTPVWVAAVAGRVRQKHIRTGQYELEQDEKRRDLFSMDLAAERWVEFGEPPIEEFAKKIGVSGEVLENWMTSRFWKIAVRHASRYIQSYKTGTKDQEKPRKEVGSTFPYHLLKQAVFLDLSGWTDREIGDVISRSHLTVEDWRKTQAWEDMEKEVFSEKLLMYIFNLGRTMKDMLYKIYESQGISYSLLSDTESERQILE